MRNRLAVAAMVVIGAGIGCGEPSPARPAVPERPGVVIHVTNDNWLDVRVYVVRDGTRWSLGHVTTCDTATFHTPSSMMGAGDIQLQADPIGGLAVYTTDRIFVTAGTHIELRIANVLAHSTFSVWTEEPADPT